jgi:geranylgeranyl reductase family protein
MFEVREVAGKFDVAVIGGGPAGAAAALELGRQGARVALFEKERLPRYKPCGGGLTRRALDALPVDVASAIERNCSEVTLALGHERLSYTLRRDKPILGMVMRDRFDFELLSAVDREGVRVFPASPVKRITKEPGRVRIFTPQGEALCRFAIAADGAVGKIARMAGWKETRRLMPALEAEVPVGGETFNRIGEAALFDFSKIKAGYAWIFPKKGHLSIGVGVFRRNGPVRLAHKLDACLNAWGLDGIKPIRAKGGVIPVSPRLDGFVRNRVILVGDAAGLADPLTGEGIFSALKSGRLAGELLVGCDFDRHKFKEAYEASLSSIFLDELRLGRGVASLVYDFPRVRNGLFALYGRKITELIADIVSGRESYKNILKNPRRYLGLFRIRRPVP